MYPIRMKNRWSFVLIVIAAMIMPGCRALNGAVFKGVTGKVFTLESSGFSDGEAIPFKFANTGYQGGQNISAGLRWSEAPAGTKSFALVCVDTNPVAEEWVHWAVVDIPTVTASLAEGASGRAMPAGARELRNTYGFAGYGGPMPPRNTGPHEYQFILYALNTSEVGIPSMPTYSQFKNAVAPHAIGTAKLTGIMTSP
jgi:Raf kinase inhibitor-like YbhB/YbcL family protein